LGKSQFICAIYREDLVGEALQILDAKHAIKREDLFIQTK
jgi:diketogulonate reductase-like aldo/keto reductase